MLHDDLPVPCPIQWQGQLPLVDSRSVWLGELLGAMLRLVRQLDHKKTPRWEVVKQVVVAVSNRSPDPEMQGPRKWGISFGYSLISRVLSH